MPWDNLEQYAREQRDSKWQNYFPNHFYQRYLSAYFNWVCPLRCQMAISFPQLLQRCSTFFKPLTRYGTQVNITVVKNKQPAHALFDRYSLISVSEATNTILDLQDVLIHIAAGQGCRCFTSNTTIWAIDHSFQVTEIVDWCGHLIEDFAFLGLSGSPLRTRGRGPG